jgi:hypothetical protein
MAQIWLINADKKILAASICVIGVICVPIFYLKKWPTDGYTLSATNCGDGFCTK